METATGDSVCGVKTRSNKTKNESFEDIQLLKNASNGHPEVNALIQDQIFQNFVENIVNPNNGPLTEDLSEDFIPHDDSVIDADDGGSSEEDLDEEEDINPPNDDEISEVNLEAAEGKAALLRNVSPAMAEAYKKRFPHFWRMKDGLQVHTGAGYDHEDDPDFLEKKRDETIELSSDESDSDSESSSGEEDEEEMVKGEEIADLTSMVEDLMMKLILTNQIIWTSSMIKKTWSLKMTLNINLLRKMAMLKNLMIPTPQPMMKIRKNLAMTRRNRWKPWMNK